MGLSKRILVLGATGFIGQEVTLALSREGFSVTGLGRRTGSAQRRFPFVQWLSRDLARMQTADEWTGILTNVDVVVNCAGALQDGLRDDLVAVQQQAMEALYAAAARTAPPPLIVQISAPSDLSAAGTRFIDTKLAADRALANSRLPHVILRPALVIGRNAYGGTALIRALAAMPGVVALVDAHTPVAAVHMDDLVRAVLACIRAEIPSGSDLVLAATPVQSLEHIVLQHRSWLGLAPARVIRLGAAAAYPITILADLAGRLGWRSPLRSTAIAVSRLGICAADARYPAADPMAILAQTPAGVQDLWFARLYLLKPVMIVVLSLFWMASGVIALLDPVATSRGFGAAIAPDTALALTYGTAFLDIVLGVCVLVQPWAKSALLAMIAVSLGYLVAGTLFKPELWLDPLGPLVKVFPSLVLTLATLAVLPER